MDGVVRMVTAEVTWALVRAGGALLMLAAFWLAGVVVQRVVQRVYEKTDPARQDVIRLMGQSAKFGLIAFGAVTALGTVGVNVATLVAGLGLTGFALGFALRDALSNFLAGVLLLVFRPFHRHDRITVTGFEGVVTAIDFRYTTLEAEDRRILIPNAMLFANPISLQRAPAA